MSGPGYSGEEKKKTFESNIILERYGDKVCLDGPLEQDTAERMLKK